MSIVKTVAGAGLAAGAAYAGYKALENMDSGSIRECGSSIKEAVGGFGRSVMASDVARDLAEKINGTKYGPKLLGAAGSVGAAFSDGFDRLVDAVADSKADAEQGKGSFGGGLAERLTGLVADGAEYIAEHIPSADDVGRAGGSAIADKLHEAGYGVEATAEPECPEI